MTGASTWTALYRLRSYMDPDYPASPSSVLTVWRDNLGGIVVGMDAGDGAVVNLMPIPDRDLPKLRAALAEAGQ